MYQDLPGIEPTTFSFAVGRHRAHSERNFRLVWYYFIIMESITYLNGIYGNLGLILSNDENQAQPMTFYFPKLCLSESVSTICSYFDYFLSNRAQSTLKKGFRENIMLVLNTRPTVMRQPRQPSRQT